ncbi:hypothetical protein GQX74_009384 [Glossina fuscipes]|nr:hypothetical protein GQX74_009384 [Glossina fuscipes]
MNASLSESYKYDQSTFQTDNPDVLDTDHTCGRTLKLTSYHFNRIYLSRSSSTKVKVSMRGKEKLCVVIMTHIGSGNFRANKFRLRNPPNRSRLLKMSQTLNSVLDRSENLESQTRRHRINLL